MEIEITYLISKKRGYKTFKHVVNDVHLEKRYNNSIVEYVSDIVQEYANGIVSYKWKILN